MKTERSNPFIHNGIDLGSLFKLFGLQRTLKGFIATPEEVRLGSEFPADLFRMVKQELEATNHRF